MPRYVKCPRCDLNYIDADTQEYCDICMAELGGKHRFIDLDDDELDDFEDEPESKNVCSMCGKAIPEGETMCEACKEKYNYGDDEESSDGEEENEDEEDDEWKSYLDDSEPELSDEEKSLKEELEAEYGDEEEDEDEDYDEEEEEDEDEDEVGYTMDLEDFDDDDEDYDDDLEDDEENKDF